MNVFTSKCVKFGGFFDFGQKRLDLDLKKQEKPTVDTVGESILPSFIKIFHLSIIKKT